MRRATLANGLGFFTGNKFLSTLSLRRATLILENFPSQRVFLSTLSLRRATSLQQVPIVARANFYPRSPCGERPGQDRLRHHLGDFYPRSPCGERRLLGGVQSLFPLISIHALLAESDLLILEAVKVFLPISIHALLAESDPLTALPCSLAFLFLSTLSLRRATGYHYPAHQYRRFLSTLSLRRATRVLDTRL